jgi:hypothetical protein
MPDPNQPTYGEGNGPKGDPRMRKHGAKANGNKPRFIVDLAPIQQRAAALKTEGLSKWYPMWKDVSKYIIPTRGFFEGMMPNWGTRIDHKLVMSSEPMKAVGALASGMQSGLTNPSTPWFRLEVDDDEAMMDEAGKEWLELATGKVRAAFRDSNVYGALYSMYEETPSFGTHAFIVLKDFKTAVRARTFTCGEYFIGCGADGRVNAFHRFYWITAGQLVEEFGYENCSGMVQAEYDNNTLDTWHQVYHLIEPNDARIPGLKDARNMAFRSVYWESSVQGNNRALLISGFEENPVIAARWDVTTTADAYGKGPGWTVMGDVKMLYKMVKKFLEALDKVVDPPVVADSSTIVNTLPGGLSRTSGNNPNGGLKPAYEIKPDLPAIQNAIKWVEDKVKTSFFVNFFLMVSQTSKDMTAEEVIQRKSEQVLMLGPIIHRLSSEGFAPLIERTFNILVRARAIPPPPPSIAGRPIKIKYISMLAQAQEMAETSIIEQFGKFVGSIAPTKPEVLDNVDFDEMVRNYAAKIGVPAKILTNPQMMAQLRAARDKQQQTAATAQNAAAAAQTGKVLADTPVGGGSALAQILAGGAPPPGGGAA